MKHRLVRASLAVPAALAVAGVLTAGKKWV